MKKTNLLLVIMAMIVAFAITSCKKSSDDNPSPSTASVDEFKTSLAKKWDLSSKGSRIENSTGYQWFEFTFDNRYLVFTNDSLYYGTYTVSDDKKTITLGTFAVISIKNLNDKDFSFSIKTYKDAAPVELFTTATTTTISSSDRTNLVCNGIWRFLREEQPGVDTTYYYDNGQQNTSTEIYVDKAEIMFSKNGTYFVSFSIKEYSFTTKTFSNGVLKDTVITIPGSQDNTIRQWKWKDASETAMLVSDSVGVFHDDDYITITKVTDSEFNYSYLNEYHDNSIVYGYAERKK